MPSSVIAVMLRLCGVPIFAVACLASGPAGAQDVRTQAPCSPVIDHVQGNVTINVAAGCTAGITPEQIKEVVRSVLAGRPIPPELLDRNERLAQQLGVTDTAVTNFFRILGEKKVAIEDLDAKLREIAAQHLTLLKQTDSQAGDDPQVAAFKQQAVTAIGAGDYGRAQTSLQHAFDADLVMARKALEGADQRYLRAAKTKADLGRLKMTQLQYAAAAQEYQAAADLVPASAPLLRAEYLDDVGVAGLQSGLYTLAGPALAEALRLREKALAADDTTVAASLHHVAFFYRVQGRYAEAERLLQRALAIDEKALGPETPAVATVLNALAMLYGDQGRYSEAEPLLERALAIDEKVGSEDRNLALHVGNLAGLRHAQGRYAEAEPLYKRALAIYEKVLEREDPYVADNLIGLADLYQAQGRDDEAEPLYKRALAIDEKVFGHGDPHAQTVRERLKTLQQQPVAAPGRTPRSKSHR